MTIQLEEEPKPNEYAEKVNQNILEIEAQVAAVVNKDITESYFHFASHTLKCLFASLALAAGSWLSARLQWLLPVAVFQLLELLFTAMILKKQQKGNLAAVLAGCCLGRAASVLGCCLTNDELLRLLVFAGFSTAVVVEVGANCYRVAKAIDQTFFIRMVEAVQQVYSILFTLWNVQVLLAVAKFSVLRETNWATILTPLWISGSISFGVLIYASFLLLVKLVFLCFGKAAKSEGTPRSGSAAHRERLALRARPGRLRRALRRRSGHFGPRPRVPRAPGPLLAAPRSLGRGAALPLQRLRVPQVAAWRQVAAGDTGTT